MAHQALQGAQARLDQLQRQCDEAFMAYEANPSNDLKKDRYAELKSSLHKAEDVVKSLATAAGAASASGWQVYCPLLPSLHTLLLSSAPTLILQVVAWQAHCIFWCIACS